MMSTFAAMMTMMTMTNAGHGTSQPKSGTTSAKRLPVTMTVTHAGSSTWKPDMMSTFAAMMTMTMMNAGSGTIQTNIGTICAETNGKTPLTLMC